MRILGKTPAPRASARHREPRKDIEGSEETRRKDILESEQTPTGGETGANIEGLLHPCPTCDCTYQSRTYLLKHIETYHWRALPDLTFTCSLPDCSQVCGSQGGIAEHARTHRQTMYTCSVCNAAFPHRNRLSEHRLHDHKDGPSQRHQCTVCEESFLNLSELSHHTLTDHQEYLVLGSGGTKHRHPCSYCHQSFTVRQDLYRHLATHVKTSAPPHPPKHHCQKCTKVFRTQSRYARHVKRCRPGYQKERTRHLCNVCGLTYADRSSFLVHVANHGGGGGLACDVCEKRFVWPTQLRVHREQHSRPYMCHTCGKTFSTAAHMKVRTVY